MIPFLAFCIFADFLSCRFNLVYIYSVRHTKRRDKQGFKTTT